MVSQTVLSRPKRNILPQFLESKSLLIKYDFRQAGLENISVSTKFTFNKKVKRDYLRRHRLLGLGNVRSGE